MTDYETLMGLVSHYSPSGQERGAVAWLVERMKALGFTDAFIDEAGNAVGVMGAGPRQVVLLGHIDTVPGEIAVALTPSPSPAGRGEALTPNPSPAGRGEALTPNPSPAGRGEALTSSPSPAGRGEALTPSPSPAGRGEALTPNPSPAGRGEALTPDPSPQAGYVLYGRGSVDAKGPLACFTDAVARVGAVTGWQFVVIGAVEEERDSDGARFVVDKYRPDFLIVGEPNRWDRVALGYKGSAWAEITVRRAQSHTASGEQTAAEAAVETWLAIRAFAETFNAGKQRAFDKILPTLRNIEAGQDGFEQWARLSVGARLPVEVSPEQWYAWLGEVAAGAEVQRVGYAVPAWSCEKNTPLVRALLSGIRSQGGSPSFVYKTGTADLNIVAPVWQCPAAVYGPGDSALDHTPQEHLSLEEYEKAVRVLAAALTHLTA